MNDLSLFNGLGGGGVGWGRRRDESLPQMSFTHMHARLHWVWFSSHLCLKLHIYFENFSLHLGMAFERNYGKWKRLVIKHFRVLLEYLHARYPNGTHSGILGS